MFAVETIVKNSLYAIKYEGNEHDELSRLFNDWSDIEYLESFFEEHKLDLQKEFYDYIPIEEAITRTLDEAEEFEEILVNIAETGKTHNIENLQTIFRPLNKNDEGKLPIPDFQECKAYGTNRKSWLRIYAVRIEPNVFIVTGGAIKLTETMNEREHLKFELEKLNYVGQLLIDEDIIDNESIKEFFKI